MYRVAPYQMHTGNPIAGWLSLVFGLAALYVYVRHISRFSAPATAIAKSIELYFSTGLKRLFNF
jgi:tetrahydromethanopterin S-methyltransferase subunit C